MPVCVMCEKTVEVTKPCDICNKEVCQKCGLDIYDRSKFDRQIIGFVCEGGGKCHFDIKVKVGHITPSILRVPDVRTPHR